jgi:hypothetical protein
MDMQADLETLRRLIDETARKSPVGHKLQKVELEPASSGDGDEYLRVMIGLKSTDDADYPELAKLIKAIEDAVGKLDERYPSVRFPDAA